MNISSTYHVTGSIQGSDGRNIVLTKIHLPFLIPAENSIFARITWVNHVRQLMITFTCHTEILTRDDLEKQADDLVSELGMSTSDFQVSTTTTTSTVGWGPSS